MNDIKVPIKDIIEKFMSLHNSLYLDESIVLLRKYFIACMNLGFIEPEYLEKCVDKFAKQISRINQNFQNIRNMDFYFIENGVLNICGDLRYENEKLYEITFYKAVSEAIFDCKNKHIGIDNALSEMAAEKIYIMNLDSSRIIVPNTVTENILNETIEIRSGYINYNLIICLLKQLFIAKQVNDNKILKDAYQYGYDKTIEDFAVDKTTGLLINALDCICLIYIKRKVMQEMNSFENILLEKYQKLVSKMADTDDYAYLALCALMTNNKLQKECLENVEI